VTRLLMNFPAGALMERFDPRRLLMCSLALSVFASTVGLVATEAWQVAFSRSITGACSAIMQAVVLSWLVGGATPATRGRIMGLSESFFSIVSLWVPLTVGLLATAISWRAAYALGLLGGVFILFAVHRWTSRESAATALGRFHQTGPSQPEPAGWAALQAGGSLLFIAYMATIVIFLGRNGLHHTVIPILGADRVGLSTVQIGLALTLYSLLGIFTQLLSGWASDRVGRPRLLLPGLATLTLCQLGLFLATGEVTFILITGLQAAGSILNPLPTSLIGDTLPASARPRGIVLFRFIADGCTLIAPAAIGVVLQYGGFDLAILVGAMPTIITLVVAAFLSRRWPRRVISHEHY
jgi:MFS family permease